MGSVGLHRRLHHAGHRRIPLRQRRHLHLKHMPGLCSSVSYHHRFAHTLPPLNYSRPFYELANYIILGRLLYYVPYHSPIHPGRVLITFGAISGIVEALNGNGASYSSNANPPKANKTLGAISSKQP